MKHKYLINAYDQNDWLFELDDGTECVHQFTLPVGPYEKNEMSDTIYHAGDSAAYHQHAEGYETFFIVKGAVEVNIRSKRCVLSPGDIIHLVPNTPHGFVYLEEGTVWRELFQGVNMAQGTVNKNHIKDNFDGLYFQPEFRRKYLGLAKNIARQAPVCQDVPKESLHEIRTPDFAFNQYNFPGVELKLKVGRWECANVKEIWHASLKKGVKIAWDEPYGEWELFYVTEGKIKFTVMGEEFVAGPDSIVHIPPYHTHSIEVLEDGALYDCGCPVNLLALLEDYTAFMAREPARLEEKQALRDFLFQYNCHVTSFQGV